MKSSFTAGNDGCGKDCGMQYLNVLKLTSKRDKDSSIPQDSMEETTLDILSNVLSSTKERLSVGGGENKLDTAQMLEDDESYLIGSILDNLLITKSTEDDTLERKDDNNTLTEESKSRYRSIKGSGEDLAQLLTRSMSPIQPPRRFTGSRMEILACKGSKEQQNVIKGGVLEFTTPALSGALSDAIPNEGDEEEEESKLVDINLLEWDLSVYNFNIEAKERLLSSKVATFNMYNGDQTSRITDQPIEFRASLNLTEP